MQHTSFLPSLNATLAAISTALGLLADDHRDFFSKIDAYGSQIISHGISLENKNASLGKYFHEVLTSDQAPQLGYIFLPPLISATTSSRDLYFYQPLLSKPKFGTISEKLILRVVYELIFPIF